MWFVAINLVEVEQNKNSRSGLWITVSEKFKLHKIFIPESEKGNRHILYITDFLRDKPGVLMSMVFIDYFREIGWNYIIDKNTMLQYLRCSFFTLQWRSLVTCAPAQLINVITKLFVLHGLLTIKIGFSFVSLSEYLRLQKNWIA